MIFLGFLLCLCLRSIMLGLAFLKNIPKVINLMHYFLEFFLLLIQYHSLLGLRLMLYLAGKLSPGRSLCTIDLWITAVIHNQNLLNGLNFRSDETRRHFLHMIIGLSCWFHDLVLVLFPGLFNKVLHVSFIHSFPRALSLVACWWTPFRLKLLVVFRLG